MKNIEKKTWNNTIWYFLDQKRFAKNRNNSFKVFYIDREGTEQI